MATVLKGSWRRNKTNSSMNIMILIPAILNVLNVSVSVSERQNLPCKTHPHTFDFEAL